MFLCLRIYKVTILLCLIISLQGCASPAPTKALNFSGFLGNYSGLRPAPDGSGAWNYRKPNVDFKPYTKIMLDPLVIWPSSQSTYGGLDASTAWRLARAFEDQMRQALAGGYPIVDRPGPGVGVESPGPLIPLANDILVRASEKVSGFNALEGEAAIEAELLDAQSHERLAAYVEKRAGSNVLLTKDKDSLGPILDLFSYWAKRLRQRLDEARGLREYQKEIQ
jgi:hypothetical protein